MTVQRELPYDGLQREVAAIISGWDGGIFTRSNNKQNPKKPIPITSEEILIQLRELKRLCNKTTIDRLFNLINTHASDYNNPHNTDLSQFATDILQLLYHEYTTRGGVAPYDTFLTILFEDYQIAGLDDIYDGTNPKLLTTVKLTAKYISEHNESEDAHTALFNKLFPGMPITFAPTTAIMSMYQISGKYQKNRGDYYTYVGRDGKRHLMDTTYLPIDYSFSKPTVPLFGDRTNECMWSRDFTKDPWSMLHSTVTYIDTLDCLNSYNDLTGASVIQENSDTDNNDHGICYTNKRVYENDIINFSIDIKPLKAKYGCIRIKDHTFGINQIVFLNFTNGKIILTDTDGSVWARLIPLNGYYRLEYSCIREMESIIDIELIFHKSSLTCPSYIGNNELLVQIDNAQMEYNVIGCSPFMYTNGEEITRHGIHLEIPIDTWFNNSNGTIMFEIVEPVMLNTSKQRNLYTLRNDTYTSIEGVFENNRTYYTRFYNTDNVLTVDYPFMVTSKPFLQMASTYSDTLLSIGMTGSTPSQQTTITNHRTDSTILDIGHNNSQNTLDGYFNTFVYYNKDVELTNITFLVGE